MKKRTIIANILWVLGVSLLLLAIVEHRNITHFLPIYLDPYTPTTKTQMDLSNALTISISCTGYLLLAISLVLTIINSSSTKHRAHTNNPIYLTFILTSLKVGAIIFTLLIIAFSLLFAFFSFLGLVVDFNTPL